MPYEKEGKGQVSRALPLSRSMEQPYDHHEMHNSTSASNYLAMVDINEHDEREFKETLASVFDDGNTNLRVCSVWWW